MTFFGGKHGFDYICFDEQGTIQASGTRTDMLEIAKKNNYAVAKLYPVKYARMEPILRRKRWSEEYIQEIVKRGGQKYIPPDKKIGKEIEKERDK